MIEKLFSTKRLAKYSSSSKEEQLRLHQYNMELSESFYPSICCLELILRNKIDIVFSEYLGDDWIFSDKYIIGQNKTYLNKAQTKKHETQNNGKDKDYIISDLNFGFWTFLFTQPYDELIWSQHPNMLTDIFQNSRDSRAKHSSNLNKMRFYRNKIFHYGSVLQSNKKLLSPEKMHSLIYRYIKDIGGNKILKEVKAIDRFDAVYEKGIENGFILLKQK